MKERILHISIPDADDELDDLVRRAAAGEEIVLTRDGQPVVRLVPVEPAEPRGDGLPR